MADLDWPSVLGTSGAAGSGFYLQPKTGGTQSPLTDATKIYGLRKPKFVCRVIVRLPRSEMWGAKSLKGRAFDAFLADLGGREHRVKLWDFDVPGGPKTFGNAAALAGTNSMTLTGANPGDINVGEYLGGDGRPHIITKLEVSGSDLLATFKPHLEADIAADTAFFEKVTGLFRATSDDIGQNFNQVGQYAEYSLDFVEDWGPSTDVVYAGETVTFSG